MLPLQRIESAYGDRTFLSGGGESVSFATFIRQVHEEINRGRFDPATIHPISPSWEARSWARLLAILCGGGVASLGGSDGVSLPVAFLPYRPLLVFRTGGTTGGPRNVVHEAKRLLSAFTLTERPPRRQLVLYAPGHIAGFDAFMQALVRGTTLIVPDSLQGRDIARAIERERVEVLPATPTLLQFLLLSGELRNRDLDSVKTIPHGAEPMPPALRERLSLAFPNARLVQRFGLTELGAIPAEPDPEDPEALFFPSDGGFDWKLEEGVLFLRSPSRMLGTLEEGLTGDTAQWWATGDLAEVTARGSLRILGRREAMINVGGSKVIPETVEALLLDEEGVVDVWVRAQPNPMTGQAVTAQVVFEGRADVMNLLRSVRKAAAKAGLSLAHVPTRLEAVDSIPRTAVGKRSRAQGKT